MTGVEAVFGVAALVCVTGAAFADVRHFEIPDAWSIAVAVLFLGFALIDLPPLEWLPHLAAGAGLFVGGALLFARGWLGGGDVKLLSACALWAGFDALPQLLMGTVTAGGLLAIAALVARRFAGPEAAYAGLREGGPLPYAVAILGGALMLAATP